MIKVGMVPQDRNDDNYFQIFHTPFKVPERILQRATKEILHLPWHSISFERRVK